MGHGVLMAHLQCMDVRRDQLFFAFKLLSDQIFENLEVDIKQRRQCAHIDHILEQLPLTRVGVLTQAHLG